jgi:hypothetical protein
LCQECTEQTLKEDDDDEEEAVDARECCQCNEWKIEGEIDEEDGSWICDDCWNGEVAPTSQSQSQPQPQSQPQAQQLSQLTPTPALTSTPTPDPELTGMQVNCPANNFSHTSTYGILTMFITAKQSPVHKILRVFNAVFRWAVSNDRFASISIYEQPP